MDVKHFRTEDKDFLRRAFKEHAVLILKHQKLDEEQQKAFAAVFGPTPVMPGTLSALSPIMHR